MKAYSFKWNKKTEQMAFSDAGRHIIKFNSHFEQICEMVKLFSRKDISIRVSFADTEGKEQTRKVSFQKTSVIIKNKNGEINTFRENIPCSKNDQSVTFEFPFANGTNIYVWYESIHNGKCVVMYGSDRIYAKPIDHTKVRFNITYKNGTTEV